MAESKFIKDDDVPSPESLKLAAEAHVADIDRKKRNNRYTNDKAREDLQIMWERIVTNGGFLILIVLMLSTLAQFFDFFIVFSARRFDYIAASFIASLFSILAPIAYQRVFKSDI